MRFYLCQTPEGPQLIYLQADAKKIDPKFEIIEMATAKEKMMQDINELMRRARAASPTAPDAPEEEESVSVSSPSPPATKSKPDKAAQYMERVFDQTAVEEFIWRVPANETFRLDTIESVCAERRDEIKKESQA